jgi:hypothetical protein
VPKNGADGRKLPLLLVGRSEGATTTFHRTKASVHRSDSLARLASYPHQFLGSKPMINMRKMISAVAAAALVATSVTPAFAGGRGYGYGYGGKYKYGRYYKRNRLDTGDVIGILAVVGLVAAIASSGKSKRRAREAGVYNESGPYKRGAINSENDAVDACALAAEDRAGKMSSVREVTKVSAIEDGWDIAGTIEARDDWRDKEVLPRGFNCVVRDGTVKAVFVDVNAVASR